MNANFSTLTLPRARAEQLRMIADTRGVSFATLIGALVNAEIARGTIPDFTPGLRFHCGIENDAVPRLLIGDAYSVELTDTRILIALAATMLDVVERRDEGGKAIKIEGHTIAVARVGRGVVVRAKSPDGDSVRVTFAPDIVRDIVRQLMAAAGLTH